MSMMVSFVLSFFPRDVLDEFLNLIESVSEDFPSYSLIHIPGYSLMLHIIITYSTCVKYHGSMNYRADMTLQFNHQGE